MDTETFNLQELNKLEREDIQFITDSMNFTDLILSNVSENNERWKELKQECTEKIDTFVIDNINKFKSVAYFRKYINITRKGVYFIGDSKKIKDFNFLILM